MVRTSHLKIEVRPPFDFRAAATSHGWIALAPTAWSPERRTVQRVERLSTGTVVLLEISAARTIDRPKILVRVHNPKPLTTRDRVAIGTAVGCVFRLDEDFAEFYALCHARGGLWARLTAGWGRLLRSPTVFEDVVKTYWMVRQRARPESARAPWGSR
jgi:hypothetical protein